MSIVEIILGFGTGPLTAFVFNKLFDLVMTGGKCDRERCSVWSHEFAGCCCIKCACSYDLYSCAAGEIAEVE
ncbi:MAG: hypothetical protein QW735_03725 [archaeon]